MWYILDDNNNPIQKHVIEAAKWIEDNPKRKVVKQESIGEIRISTVFLGLDHSYNSPIPVLWETMIFGGEHDQYQERYSSYEEAVEGHETAVEMVKISIELS
jgi:hypothetical protein